MELCIIALTGASYSTDTWVEGATIASLIGAIVFIFLLMALTGHTPQWGLNLAHGEIARKQAAAMAKERGYPTQVAFDHGMPDAKGILICVQADAWSELSKDFLDTQERTGWSKLTFHSEQGYTSSDWSEDAGAELLEVPHLGVVLDNDECGT